VLLSFLNKMFKYNNAITEFIYFFSYAGRPTAASPATGSKMQHLRELTALLEDAMAV
jgi:2-oxoglutarate dehydrogenase complex dehydrogenase (E1) component-like enzyme